ncbi:MAG: Do family serine endopeptidase [Gammaproteobacteria bacterium]|nr:Do family serine endopeptidase [Gammaproteobacteria bacterium]
MRITEIMLYLGRAIVLGLAIAFILVIAWPSLTSKSRTPVVEIHQAAPVTASSPTPASGPASYSQAVDNAAPAVVNINTAKVVKVQQHPFFDDPIFRQFFGRQLDNLVGPKQRVVTSLGSGVIISHEGYILTNNHVIKDADAIQVSLRDGRTASAKLVGADTDTDLAVLKIELENLPVIVIGNSDMIRVGDVVLAIGNPFGVGQTVTMGIISATGRSRLGINTFENFIQTDAAINPGNSGGALIDAYGNLLGINTAIFSKSGGSQGIGFAIPVSMAQAVLRDIIEHGRPLRGWLGIDGNPVTPEIARSLGLKKIEGILIVGVYRNGPAHKSGVEPGDIMVAIDGKRFTHAQEALMAISNHRPGEQLTLTVLREGQEKQITITVIERPQEAPTLRK